MIYSVAAPGLGIWGGIWGATRIFGGGKIEFHEISPPPPRCQNFWPPGFFPYIFSEIFSRTFLIFFQTFKNCPTKIFHGPTKNFSQTYQKCNFFSNIS